MNWGSITSLWSVKEDFRLKVFLLSAAYFFLFACQAIWRPLKASIFAKMVGAHSTPDAKLYVIFVLIPLILIYSKLVDNFRRHHLVYWFTLFHGIGGVIFYTILSHPVYGIMNTQASPSRLTGWLFYFFMESFSAFLTTTIWSFANSINKPKDAKTTYGFLVIGSKIGGMVSAGLLYLLIVSGHFADHILLPVSVLAGSIFLLFAAGSIWLLMKYVPGYLLHGYEASYQAEKHREHETVSMWESFKGMFSGVFVIISNSYVAGITALVIMYEVIIVIFDYRVLLVADQIHETAGALTSFYASYYFWMNFIGLLFAFFGTVPLQRLLKFRTALFVYPVIALGIAWTTFFMPTANVLFIGLVLLRSLNYAVNHPTRESLYIPTTKEIKFKAKAWTDAFGSRFAKAAGSSFNIVTKALSQNNALLAGTLLTSTLLGIWMMVVSALEHTFKDAVEHNTIIGNPESENTHHS